MLSPLNFYLLAVFLLAIASGVQVITIPWLALDYMGVSSWQVGLIQAAVLLPSTALLLLGGISADHGGLVKKSIVFAFVLAVVHAVLAIVIFQNWLSLVLLVLYGLALGSINAYFQPCKEHVIGSLAKDQLQSTIAKNSLAQSGGQAIGMGLASVFYTHHVLSLPISQVVFTLLALVSLLFFRQRSQENFSHLDQQSHRSTLTRQLLLSGIAHCWQSPVLRGLIIIVALSGFFHIGVFVVALPILAKTVYVGDVGLYSLLQVLFVVGSMVTTIVVVLKGQLDSPGRRVIFSVLYAGLILLGLSYGPTPYGLMTLIFLWGVVVGISASLGRAILQSQTSAEFRGRAISVYQLALFGCAPLGSICAGIAIEWFGVLKVLHYSAIASFIVFGGLFLTRALWDVEAEDTVSSANTKE